MAVLTARELYDIAVGIERNGVAYYDSLAQLATDHSLKDAYGQLANMERHHIDVFQALQSETGTGPVVPEDEQDEYRGYLQALIDSSVFTSDKVARDLARRASGPADALQLALGAEKDSILFYSEMRSLVPQRDRESVDLIIREERMHLRDLSALKLQFS